MTQIQVDYRPTESTVIAWFFGKDGIVSNAEWQDADFVLSEPVEFQDEPGYDECHHDHEDEYEPYDYEVAEETMRGE